MSPSSSPTQVNLLELAASTLASTIVAARKIRKLSNENDDDDHDHDDANVPTTANDSDNNADSDNKNVRLKDDGSYITDADIASQGILVQAIRQVSANVRIVGEESDEDMRQAQHLMSQEDAFDETTYQLALDEISIRYNRSPTDRLPLSQSVLEDPSSSILSSSASSAERMESQQSHDDDAENDESPTHRSAMSLPLSECNVDIDRVCVFIDPLDGTKAYARGEYDVVSILIAIILDQRPCFGIICKPFGYRGKRSILDTGCVCFYGGTLLGGVYTAGSLSQTIPDAPKDASPETLPRAVISGSRAAGIVQDFCSYLGEKGVIHPEPLLVGGAGEKSLRIILRSQQEGLWFYPKPGTSLWDVAASDALLRASGGKLTDSLGNDMDYSKSRDDAENIEGVIACFDKNMHSECLQLFRNSSWSKAT